MQSLKHVLTQVVQRGRIGRKRSFVLALGLALFVLPVATALAYFNAVGTGTFSGVTATTSSPSTVSVTQTASSPYVYCAAGYPNPALCSPAAGAPTTLPLGGVVIIPVDITCTAGAPCQWQSLTLQSWTSNKTGCDATTLPGSFSIQANTSTSLLSGSLATVGAKVSGSVVIQWNNLSSLSQDACIGATFSYTLAVA